MVDPRGFAPRSPLCGGGILLLDDGPWCSPGELNSALHGFNVTCDRYTRTADVVGWPAMSELKRARSARLASRMDAEAGVEPAAPTFRASSPYRYRVLGNGGLDGSRTRYLRLDKAAPPRLRPRDQKNCGLGISDCGLA